MKPSPLVHRRHAVQFYGIEQSLFATVSEFLAEGLIAHQAAIVIATEAHLAGVLQAIESRRVDADRARRSGELVLLDAHELMGTFMVGSMPHPQLFEYNVGLVFDQATRVRGRMLMRAYGEIVDVLWREGHTDGAIKLEMLWNNLAAKYGFALPCGYSMGSFSKETDGFQEISRHHAHIVEPGSRVFA